MYLQNWCILDAFTTVNSLLETIYYDCASDAFISKYRSIVSTFTMPKFSTVHVKVDHGQQSRRTVYEHEISCFRGDEKMSSSDNPARKSTVWDRLGHKNTNKHNARDPVQPNSTKPTVWQRLGNNNTTKPNASDPIPLTSVELAVRPVYGKSRFRSDRKMPLSENSPGKLTVRHRLGYKNNDTSRTLSIPFHQPLSNLLSSPRLFTTILRKPTTSP